jgi:hypothetical protein
MNPLGKKMYTPIFQQLSIFFAFVTLMQIYDIIFWNSLNTNNGKTEVNKIATKMAMITNHLQPILLAYVISNVIPIHKTSIIIVLVYAIIALIYSVDIWNKLDYTTVTEQSYPALHWKWNTPHYSFIPNQLMYGLFLLAFTVVCFELPPPIRYIALATNIGTYVYSFYMYKTSLTGKMWCYIAAYMPLIIWASQWIGQY